MASFVLPLTQLSLTYGCTDLSAGDCLTPYTRYLVEIAVIRTTSIGTTAKGAPKSVYISTQHSIASGHNSSSIFLYALTITMNFTVAVPFYGESTPINATFLHPLNLHTTKEDLNIDLTQCSVYSVSNSSIKVVLSVSEYEYIVSTIYARSFLFTPFLIQYGSAQTVEPCNVHCLSRI